MNYKTLRGMPRPTLSPRHLAVNARTAPDHGFDAPLIPIHELRRLVAAMVD